MQFAQSVVKILRENKGEIALLKVLTWPMQKLLPVSLLVLARRVGWCCSQRSL